MQKHIKENPDVIWVNGDMLVSKAGKGYAKLDTWEPDKKQEPESSEDIPF